MCLLHIPFVEVCAQVSQGGLQVGDDALGGGMVQEELSGVDGHEQLSPTQCLLPVKVGDGGQLLAQGGEFGHARVDERNPASGLEIYVHGHGVHQACERTNDDIEGEDVGSVTHDGSGLSD